MSAKKDPLLSGTVSGSSSMKASSSLSGKQFNPHMGSHLNNTGGCGLTKLWVWSNILFDVENMPCCKHWFKRDYDYILYI